MSRCRYRYQSASAITPYCRPIIIDDGKRLWLIDVEYGGFSMLMFDLANLASKAGLSDEWSVQLLVLYYAQSLDVDLLRRHTAMQCISFLREAIWSMVSELCPNAPGADYEAYHEEYLESLALILDGYRSRFGRV